MNRPQLKELLLSSTLLGLAGLSIVAVAPASAQEAAPRTSGDDDVVVVTGTRISREGYVSSSPITTIDADELSLKQPVDVEEVLRAHNLAIKPVGIASTVAVVDKGERAPVELSTGPRAAGGSRKPAGGAKGLSKKDRAAMAAGASVEKVKAEKAVKLVKAPKPAKVPVVKATKPAKVKAAPVATAKKEKPAKPLKEVKPAKVKPAKVPAAKPAKKEKAVKAPATPAV